MSVSRRAEFMLWGAVVAVALAGGWKVFAQATPPTNTKCEECGEPVNDPPNPYRTVNPRGADGKIPDYFKLPDGRSWGSTSLVDIDKDGKSVWVVDRCGANSCISDPATGALNPENVIFHYDENAKLITSFGGGMIVMPHGIYVDKDDNVWVTDNGDNAPRAARGAGPGAAGGAAAGGGRARGAGGAAAAAPGAAAGGAAAGGGRGRGGAAGAAAPAAANQAAGGAAGRGAATPPGPGVGATKGHQVFKFSPDGKLLMTIGKPGGSLTECCFQPNDVIVAPDGDIFISQGHNDTPGTVQVVWKLDPTGKLIKPFGTFGHGPGEFDQPHALAFDSAGRLFVGDRNNNRIQIFDQNGYLLDTWHQFGRPSGIFIDKKDMLYVADSESMTVSRNHLGWGRGIRIGSAKDGKVIAYIPDPDVNATGTSAAEGVAADDMGNIYGAEVGPRAVKKYVKK